MSSDPPPLCPSTVFVPPVPKTQENMCCTSAIASVSTRISNILAAWKKKSEMFFLWLVIATRTASFPPQILSQAKPVGLQTLQENFSFEKNEKLFKMSEHPVVTKFRDYLRIKTVQPEPDNGMSPLNKAKI